MRAVEFEIPGYCQPKQRTFGNRFVTPPETRAYEKLVRQVANIAMKGNPPLLGFVSLSIRIYCSIPQSWSSKKRGLALRGELMPTHCDVDNCVKAITDGMNRTVFLDDRFVNELIVRRQYTEVEEKTYVTVSVIEQ
jgi:Holliday junction resolvase RusA-like endonuclease